MRIMENNPLYDAIADAVQSIQNERRSKNRVPDHAMIVHDNIPERLAGMCNRKEFLEAIREMEEKGIIITGSTARDTYVRIKQ